MNASLRQQIQQVGFYVAPCGLRVVGDAVAQQRLHVRTESAVLEVGFKNSNKLRPARFCAFLFQVVLKRCDNRGQSIWFGDLVSAQYKSNRSRPRFR